MTTRPARAGFTRPGTNLYRHNMGVSLALEDKVALVTGGSRGIGAEIVRVFAQAGARVVFSYRQAREPAEALVRECGGPGRCVAIEQELSSPAHGRALVAAAV